MDVEFVFDVPCVWSCFAYARFQRAAARIRAGGGEVTVRFRPFQLDPRATADGEPKIDVLRRAFGAGRTTPSPASSRRRRARG
ncbi:DsbA family protein [Micromonospora sp. NPDC047465]|uniref:DsbA family protein n=1 Tax=Micromonospora sp. NPDC047465 TaxID=3154813 RepID=UPI0033C6A0E3